MSFFQTARAYTEGVETTSSPSLSSGWCWPGSRLPTVNRLPWIRPRSAAGASRWRQCRRWFDNGAMNE